MLNNSADERGWNGVEHVCWQKVMFEEQSEINGSTLPPVANHDTVPTAIVPSMRLVICAGLTWSHCLFIYALKDRLMKCSNSGLVPSNIHPDQIHLLDNCRNMLGQYHCLHTSGAALYLIICAYS